MTEQFIVEDTFNHEGNNAKSVLLFAKYLSLQIHTQFQ
jgi:hypothetical protein